MIYKYIITYFYMLEEFDSDILPNCDAKSVFNIKENIFSERKRVQFCIGQNSNTGTKYKRLF